MKQKIVLSAKLIVAGLALALISSCGKKESETSMPPALTGSPATSPAQNTTAAPAPVPTIAPDARLAESQAALKANDYEKAAATLISLQRTQMSEQQAAAMTAQMKQLQGNLSAAVASGDPRAKAAAARLRESTPR